MDYGEYSHQAGIQPQGIAVMKSWPAERVLVSFCAVLHCFSFVWVFTGLRRTVDGLLATMQLHNAGSRTKGRNSDTYSGSPTCQGLSGLSTDLILNLGFYFLCLQSLLSS